MRDRENQREKEKERGRLSNRDRKRRKERERERKRQAKRQRKGDCEIKYKIVNGRGIEGESKNIKDYVKEREIDKGRQKRWNHK